MGYVALLVGCGLVILAFILNMQTDKPIPSNLSLAELGSYIEKRSRKIGLSTAFMLLGIFFVAAAALSAIF